MEPRQANNEEELRSGGDPGLDLRRYWNVIKKRRWIVIGMFALVVAASVVLILRKQPIYQATATVVVNPQVFKAMGSSAEQVVELGSGSMWISIDYYNTQQRIITS